MAESEQVRKTTIAVIMTSAYREEHPEEEPYHLLTSKDELKEVLKNFSGGDPMVRKGIDFIVLRCQEVTDEIEMDFAFNFRM